MILGAFSRGDLRRALVRGAVALPWLALLALPAAAEAPAPVVVLVLGLALTFSATGVLERALLRRRRWGLGATCSVWGCAVVCFTLTAAHTAYVAFLVEHRDFGLALAALADALASSLEGGKVLVPALCAVSFAVVAHARNVGPVSRRAAYVYAALLFVLSCVALLVVVGALVVAGVDWAARRLDERLFLGPQTASAHRNRVRTWLRAYLGDDAAAHRLGSTPPAPADLGAWVAGLAVGGRPVVRRAALGLLPHAIALAATPSDPRMRGLVEGAARWVDHDDADGLAAASAAAEAAPAAARAALERLVQALGTRAPEGAAGLLRGLVADLRARGVPEAELRASLREALLPWASTRPARRRPNAGGGPAGECVGATRAGAARPAGDDSASAEVEPPAPAGPTRERPDDAPKAAATPPEPEQAPDPEAPTAAPPPPRADPPLAAPGDEARGR